MHLFFIADISDTIIPLPAEEAKHCIGVLRLREGQSITVTDGKGFFYDASIQTVTKKQVTVSIHGRKECPPDRNYKLHIGIAPTKNSNRFEWFIEKVTEIGIDEITPLLTHNSERRDLRNDRLEKIMISAMKQSLKATKPVLNPIISLDEFLNNRYSDHQLFIAYCTQEKRILLRDIYKPGENAVLLIGPEGDFTSEEVEQANLAGYQTISLGRSRLRTETAGITSCHSFYLLNQNYLKS